MKQLLIMGILMVSTAPVFAQGQQPDAAKLKADARNVVSTITGDKAKSQTYCLVLDLSDELDQVDRHKEPKKAEDPVAEGRRFAKKTWPRISRTARKP